MTKVKVNVIPEQLEGCSPWVQWKVACHFVGLHAPMNNDGRPYSNILDDEVKAGRMHKWKAGGAQSSSAFYCINYEACKKQKHIAAGLKASKTKGPAVEREAGLKAATTKRMNKAKSRDDGLSPDQTPHSPTGE